jgi:3-(3-hydroxy-phenyl)propionate hydroxylase
MRLAARYRAGRLLLAGDAAHLNSPSGGMGMNAGIHDAFALTGALARVIAGGSPALLDAYGEKRRRVAEQEILRQADSNRARMQERDPVLRRSLFEDLRRTAGDPALAIPHLLRSSMITGLRASGEQLYE